MVSLAWHVRNTAGRGGAHLDLELGVSGGAGKHWHNDGQAKLHLLCVALAQLCQEGGGGHLHITGHTGALRATFIYICPVR